MKYFVDDDYWDVLGYSKQLREILPQFNKKTRKFLRKHSFHDGEVRSLEILNYSDLKKKDPTTIRMVIEQYEGGTYQIEWLNVQKFFMDYDIKRNTYGGKSKKIVFGGKRGLADWGYDEILPLTKKTWQHEIYLFSETTIIIQCRDIQIKKIKN